MILIHRDYLEFKNKFISYLLLWFSIPMLLYLCLTVPLSSYIDQVNLMNYKYWSLPGIWICSSCLMSFLYSFVKLKTLASNEEYLNRYLKSPISNGQILSSLLISSILAGLFQLICSIVTTSSLSGLVITTSQAPIILFNILILLIFFSTVGLFCAFYFHDHIFSTILSLIILIFLMFGCGTFLPVNEFPNNFLILIANFPIYGLIYNVQLSYQYSRIIISPIVVATIINISMFIIVLIISYKKFRK